MMTRALAVCSVLILAACSGEPQTTEETTPTAETPAAEPANDPAQSPADDGAERPPPPRRVDASQTLCRQGERAFYNCPLDDGRVVSVCFGDQHVYRFGPLGDPELEISRAPGAGDVYYGVVVGQGGGQQTHIRFRNGGHDYVVFSGYNGRLADEPGRAYSGVSVLRDGAEVRRLECPVTSPQTEIPSSMIPEDIPHETGGGEFDAWY